MGINPSGVNTDGSKSEYHDNILSSGMAIANIYYRPTDNLKINLWNGLLDNVMNTAMIEINTNQNLNAPLINPCLVAPGNVCVNEAVFNVDVNLPPNLSG